MSEAREEGELDQGAPDFTKKHPLEQSWTLWFDNPTAKQTINKFGQTLKEVYTFDTVEDFWCLYNNIKTPGQLQPSATFMLFKQGIHPKWEDPKNEHGGCWTASLNKGTSTVKQQIDAWWLNSALACIGEQFPEGDEICGVAVNIRNKGDRIELWTKTSSNEAVQNQIGRKLKEFLDIPDSMKIGYCVFKDKINNQKAKDKYSC
ncbi:eukaryotic initiation factor [Haematococcus lacustris]